MEHYEPFNKRYQVNIYETANISSLHVPALITIPSLPSVKIIITLALVSISFLHNFATCLDAHYSLTFILK